MSHIVRGQVDLAYTDIEVLKKALASIGEVHENEFATIATGVGYAKSGERYPLVLQSRGQADFRVGFKREANGGFAPYYDEWGDLGRWCNQANAAVKDRYIAYHYEKQLKAEGYDVSVHSQADGSLEVLAEEASW